MGPPAYDLGYFLATSTQDPNPTDSNLSLWIDHYLNAMNVPRSAVNPALTRAGLIQDIVCLLPIIAWTPVMMLLTAELTGRRHSYWRAVLTRCETLSTQLKKL